MKNVWSGKRHKYATHEGLVRAAARQAERLANSKTMGQPEPGIFQSRWPLPRAKVINTWAAVPSPILGLPYIRYDLEVEGMGIVVFNRFVGAPLHGYDTPA